MFSELPECSLHNEYGPSEAHVVTAYELQGSPEGWPKRVPIGRPIANARIYLLDRSMQPVPVGVPGELYIAGVCLAAGYLDLPEKTAERFVPDPFDGAPEARLYRTGDLARYLPDGTIEFLGRVDHQMKIRGYRIEPGEIEAVLEQHPAVAEALVMPWERAPGDTRLLAYLAVGGQAVPTVSALRSFLLEKLPEYMVPSTFVFLEAFPLTANGKVDRRALPRPESERPVLESTYVAPRSGVEREIARIWQEALRVETVGVDDNFFDLGGHSLLVVQVQRRLREAFGRDVSLVDLFRYPTVSSLARYLGQTADEPRGFDAAHDRARRQREALASQNRLAKGKQAHE
jgi:acyl carrier protein